MKFVVLGSGLMGGALAYDLAHSPGVRSVTLADVDGDRARTAAESIGSTLVRPATLDVENREKLAGLLRDHTCAISAVPYRYNVQLTEAALEAGIHFLDLGGNDDVVRQQRAFHGRARERGVLILPNCGLAPGLANVLAARGAEEFDSVDSIRIRVGGLPQVPLP
ncbi:MAG: saccharopine dehydrogenase NADP-binding domain-containing protein, partial [Bacteroidota bacterium]